MATIPVGQFPTGVAFTPDGTQAYVVNEGSGRGTVSVIKTATNTVVATVIVNGASAVAVSPNGQDVYVAKSPNKVRVIATATNTKVAVIPVGNGPSGLAIGP